MRRVALICRSAIKEAVSDEGWMTSVVDVTESRSLSCRRLTTSIVTRINDAIAVDDVAANKE